MKKILMGIVWFIIFQFFFGIIFGLVASGFSAVISKQDAMNLGIPIVLLSSLGFVIWGTIKGKLPGTK